MKDAVIFEYLENSEIKLIEDLRGQRRYGDVRRKLVER
jgi:hypothetical protein